MIGSPAVAAAIALWGFWVLLAAAVASGELKGAGTLAFLLFWTAGLVGFGLMSRDSFFAPYVAALDIALVLVVFKGDVRLT